MEYQVLLMLRLTGSGPCQQRAAERNEKRVH
jgi:hypothetical protein